MADSTLADRRQQPMVEISIPVGYTHALSPEEQQYVLTLDPQVVMAQAQEWNVLPEQASYFIYH